MGSSTRSSAELGVAANAAKLTERAACPQCASSRAEALRMRELRDLALKALAEERERNNALRLNYPNVEHSVGSHRVPLSDLQTPLRYVFADALNGLFKNYLRPAHSAIKHATSLIYRLTNIGSKRAP